MKTTRTALSIITTLTLGTLAGVMLWATGAFFAAETYGLAAGGVFATLAMLTFFSVSLQESTRRLRKRGYARPVSSGNVFESAARVIRQAHPVKERAAIPIKFDDGKTVEIDVDKLYYFCRAGYSDHRRFAWHQNKTKMSKAEWDAIRFALDQAGAVTIDGRGAMRLNCTPWAAVERVRNT